MAIAGKNVSTRRAAGAFNTLPLGWVTGYPIAVWVDASNAGKASAGSLQVAPPSVDLLYSAAAWQPLFVKAGQRPPLLSLIIEDQTA